MKATKVQNVNGTVRVVSEHQLIMKSSLRNGVGSSAVPPLLQTQTRMPAWVVLKSGLPGVGGGVREWVGYETRERERERESVRGKGGDEANGDVHVRKMSIERRVFSPTICEFECGGWSGGRWSEGREGRARLYNKVY